MNIIEKLNNQIVAANDMLARYETVLDKEPKNIAYQLSAISVKSHISELQHQLQREKILREKEVLEIRLKGVTANGSIPLSVLSELSLYLSDALQATSQKVKTGLDAKRRILKDIVNTLDLRLAGLATGSTRLIITGNSSPDLFGQSLLESSLENTFALLESRSAEELTEGVSKVGIRSANKFNKFLKTISDSGYEVDISWVSPTKHEYDWKASMDDIRSLSNSLDSITMSQNEIFEFKGKLVMASLKGAFEIETDAEETIKGKFPTQLTEYVKKLHIGDKCNGMIEKETITNRTTGLEKVYYTLLEIEAI
ncbi:MAG: hypothetical protein HZA22_06730 [Nitrospirae bacterium]|nr:hypothetical protein [Nitrospirota bacterium]